MLYYLLYFQDLLSNCYCCFHLLLHGLRPVIIFFCVPSSCGRMLFDFLSVAILPRIAHVAHIAHIAHTGVIFRCPFNVGGHARARGPKMPPFHIRFWELKYFYLHTN